MSGAGQGRLAEVRRAARIRVLVWRRVVTCGRIGRRGIEEYTKRVFRIRAANVDGNGELRCVKFVDRDVVFARWCPITTLGSAIRPLTVGLMTVNRKKNQKVDGD